MKWYNSLIKKRTQSQRVQVSGEWMDLFWKKQPIFLYATLEDVSRFLLKKKLPYLYPKDEKYKENIDSKTKPQISLRIQWVVAYLNHPSNDVVLEVLKKYIPTDLIGTLAFNETFTNLLLNSNSVISKLSAVYIWKCNNNVLEAIFNILTSQGFIPSGINPADAERAITVLRKECPQNRQAFFNKLVLEKYGPKIAGFSPTNIEGVIFKEKVRKEGALDSNPTYEVYTAKTKQEAISFLETKKIAELNYFIIVETPDGNWGKDCYAIFEES